VKLIEYFDNFLAEKVNLNPTRVAELDSRVESITTALRAGLGERFVEIVPQGSWAHRTIIRPAPTLEFDADFLIRLDEESAWNSDPSKYSSAVWDVLSDHSTYGSMAKRKNRCVRITYANDCHVDVVPYVICNDGRQYIVNRTSNEFEETNPVGFTEWLQEKDDLTSRNLRKTIRLLKHLRDRRGAFALKSVLLTTLAGEVVDSWHTYDPGYYKDVPTTLVHLLENLDSWLQQRPTKPYISDPSCNRTSFDHRWTDSQYVTFRERIHELTPRMRAAYDATAVAASVTAWQDIFGSDFPNALPAAALAASTPTTVLTKSAVPAGPPAPGEEFIEQRAVLNITHHVTLGSEFTEPTAWNRAMRRRSLRSRRGHVPKERSLRFFIADTDVPEPYTVLWKVRNHGVEAARLGQLRGQIMSDGGQRSRTETSRYSGRHWVECYIVKTGVCVARDHQDVVIP
jgi:hypothetical protein